MNRSNKALNKSDWREGWLIYISIDVALGVSPREGWSVLLVHPFATLRCGRWRGDQSLLEGLLGGGTQVDAVEGGANSSLSVAFLGVAICFTAECMHDAAAPLAVVAARSADGAFAAGTHHLGIRFLVLLRPAEVREGPLCESGVLGGARRALLLDVWLHLGRLLESSGGTCLRGSGGALRQVTWGRRLALLQPFGCLRECGQTN